VDVHKGIKKSEVWWVVVSTLDNRKSSEQNGNNSSLNYTCVIVKPRQYYHRRTYGTHGTIHIQIHRHTHTHTHTCVRREYENEETVDVFPHILVATFGWVDSFAEIAVPSHIPPTLIHTTHRHTYSYSQLSSVFADVTQRKQRTPFGQVMVEDRK
jgi:hypothetical protein